jgi:hypothetical protein
VLAKSENSPLTPYAAINTSDTVNVRLLVIDSAWNNVGVHVLGSIKPIEFSKEKIKGKLEITSVAQDIFEWEVIPLDYFDKIVPLELPGYQGLIVTDDHPFLEFNLLRYLRRGTRKSSPLTAW